METLERLKLLLGISADDILQDDLLEAIIDLTIAHFGMITGRAEVPESLEYMIVEVAIKRFNRLGSEGYGSKSIEGLSIQFGQSDFDEFLPYLKKLYPNQFGQKGVKFL